jgi:hypothetical protein
MPLLNSAVHRHVAVIGLLAVVVKGSRICATVVIHRRNASPVLGIRSIATSIAAHMDHSSPAPLQDHRTVVLIEFQSMSDQYARQ